MPIITDATLAKIQQQMAVRNAKLKDFVDLYAANSWDRIQVDVKSMSKADLLVKYPIGTELVCNYAYNGVDYDFPWVVLDVRDCEWGDGTTHQGLWLGAKYACIEGIQFDAPEAVVATEATAQSGVYYFKKNGSDFVLLNVSAGDTLPTDQGTLYKHMFNNTTIPRYGYNNYKGSAIRQWLNSDKARNLWWEAQHDYDVRPDQATTEDGFLYRLDPELKAVITPVKVPTSCNTVTDNGVTETVCDKIFLQSLEQVYGSPQIAGVEGAYFPWWKDATGYTSPTNGSSSNTVEARKIRKVNNQSGSAVTTWLRSALRGHGTYVWYFSTSGYLSNGGSASTANAPLPACVIS